MRHLIDSDWIIDRLANAPEALKLLDRLAPDGIAVGIVTYMEAFQGTLREPNPDAAQARLESLMAVVPILPFSAAVARRCAGLREELGSRGRSVRPRALDLIVAATALEYDLALVTRNVRDYRDISRLRLFETSGLDSSAST